MWADVRDARLDSSIGGCRHCRLSLFMNNPVGKRKTLEGATTPSAQPLAGFAAGHVVAGRSADLIK